MASPEEAFINFLKVFVLLLSLLFVTIIVYSFCLIVSSHMLY